MKNHGVHEELEFCEYQYGDSNNGAYCHPSGSKSVP